VDAVPKEAAHCKVIVGYFDPLHAGHTRRLRELCRNGERIVVAVDDPPEPILPARARAELVAALNCVAYVLVSPSRQSPNMIDERQQDAQRARVFAQHVVARHNTK